MRKNLTGILFGILVVIGILIWTANWQKPSGEKFVINFFDVGQGDAIYMQFPNGQDALVDGGPKNRVLDELGTVMPFWDKDLDLVVLTHNHADHLEGLLEVLQRYEVKQVWLSGAIHTSNEYLDLLKIIKDKKINTEVVKSGMEKKFGEVEARVLYPIRSWKGESPENQHEADIVTRWSFGKFSVLITGDLGYEQLNDLVDSGEYLKSTILKVPHHGSATGLTKELLEVVAPKVAIISAGKNNRYGHPAESTLHILENFGVTVYRTDENGKIRFESDGIGYDIK